MDKTEHPPTLIFTSATAGLRGSANCSSFATGKFALRALYQSLAREFGPKGIHVAHAIIDGVIDIERTKHFKFDHPDAKISPDAVSHIDFLVQLPCLRHFTDTGRPGCRSRIHTGTYTLSLEPPSRTNSISDLILRNGKEAFRKYKYSIHKFSTCQKKALHFLGNLEESSNQNIIFSLCLTRRRP